jgi:transcriptional regulator with XRE-family HTH domain
VFYQTNLYAIYGPKNASLVRGEGVIGRSPIGSSFDDFIEEVWQEAREEGPEAVRETAFAEQRARFAVQLLALRVARQLSQVELARASGLQQAEISHLERGLGNPTLKTLSALGQTLGFELAAVPPGTVHPIALSEQEPETRSEPTRGQDIAEADAISSR